MIDMVSKIVSYECGEMDEDEMINLFSNLVKNGMVWKLQGHYGRTASQLIEMGVLDSNGDILV